ncbi:hypothetical protein NLI96_g3397 [Meripilus lineatus]|uniref:Uncharacterized protein n=1 Tax=Meripilus lineatus TaxID=2056292 RepID=A0AAD5VCA6_9APHY|nr:hypothetical protein NLI96_g3397 [Physisporinus lineatus]
MVFVKDVVRALRATLRNPSPEPDEQSRNDPPQSGTISRSDEPEHDIYEVDAPQQSSTSGSLPPRGPNVHLSSALMPAQSREVIAEDPISTRWREMEAQSIKPPKPKPKLNPYDVLLADKFRKQPLVAGKDYIPCYPSPPGSNMMPSTSAPFYQYPPHMVPTVVAGTSQMMYPYQNGIAYIPQGNVQMIPSWGYPQQAVMSPTQAYGYYPGNPQIPYAGPVQPQPIQTGSTAPLPLHPYVPPTQQSIAPPTQVQPQGTPAARATDEEINNLVQQLNEALARRELENAPQVMTVYNPGLPPAYQEQERPR